MMLRTVQELVGGEGVAGRAGIYSALYSQLPLIAFLQPDLT